METSHWLSLANYSSKYSVSISTLRRRIKSEMIDFKLHDGKYFLLDSAPILNGVSHATSQAAENSSSHFRSNSVPTFAQAIQQQEKLEMKNQKPADDEPVIASATKLLGELKKAYTSILHDKEEQLIQLKEEVSDLKMLVRVLEGDNERLKKLIYSEN